MARFACKERKKELTYEGINAIIEYCGCKFKQEDDKYILKWGT